MSIKKWKILVSGSELCKEAQYILLPKSEVVHVPQPASAEKIANEIKKQKTEGLIVRSGKINETVLKASSQLKVIVDHGIGYDHIDVCEAKRLGIPVYKYTFCKL